MGYNYEKENKSRNDLHSYIMENDSVYFFERLFIEKGYKYKINRIR